MVRCAFLINQFELGSAYIPVKAVIKSREKLSQI